ncbi:protein-tyrosine phosphatase [Microbacterium halimionae]|uniref:protein-tyrosine-phosphatase n=1 Tax=Microbacterium halimionae TaxID=1526413 RepID=A0A7W3PMK0_9MICO|nr:low molecular weight protein-tyrosine-phosphatase [Microbacterium halimionae]MBA8817004.1 protein-tyrosine phosphatase [Microbacterium halimionae]
MSAAGSDPFRVVFVCTGNICRSPMADVVFRRLVADAGLAGRATSTSAGTGDWHVGEQADHRAIDALSQEGYDGSLHRARQFTPADFDQSDLVVALDRTHERILRGWARSEADADKIALLLSFGTSDQLDVPDPYYAGPEMFDDVLAMIENACRALFRQLHPAIRAV